MEVKGEQLAVLDRKIERGGDQPATIDGSSIS